MNLAMRPSRVARHPRLRFPTTESMMSQFIPRNRLFWLYHLGAMLFTGAVSLVTAYLWGSPDAMFIASTLAWTLPYTVAVLGFRWVYRVRQWDELPMGRLLAVAIFYATLAGLAIAAVVQALILPWFWQGMVDARAATAMPLHAHEYVVRRLIGDGLQAQLFVAAWIFIYISVTGSRRIRQAELVNLRLQNSLKEAQLSSLSNQLNPHFLFNALNNIRFMIHESQQRADGMLVALSDMLRYSLESVRHEKVPLGQEVAIIGQYVAVMEAQLEARLRFALDVPSGLHGCLIPPMVPQMLVENAIKHGIDQLPLGGDLTVQASEVCGRIVLVVTNDVPRGLAQPRDGLGIGLHNIRRRLQLLYGDHAALDVVAGDGCFSVAMTVPKEFA